MRRWLLVSTRQAAEVYEAATWIAPATSLTLKRLLGGNSRREACPKPRH